MGFGNFKGINEKVIDLVSKGRHSCCKVTSSFVRPSTRGNKS